MNTRNKYVGTIKLAETRYLIELLDLVRIQRRVFLFWGCLTT